MKGEPWILGMPVRLETERFVLRSMRGSDITSDYMRWIADPDLMRNLNIPPLRNVRDQEAERLKSYDHASGFQLGIFVKPEGELIGFFQVRIDRHHKLAETSVVIGDRDWWGRNAVVETRQALVDFLFGRMKVEKIWGMPQVRNFPAILNYRKQGFRLEGVLRGHHTNTYGGPRLDLAVFAMLRQEWQDRKKKAKQQ